MINTSFSNHESYIQLLLSTLIKIFDHSQENWTKLRELEQLKRICVIFVKLRKAISNSV